MEVYRKEYAEKLDRIDALHPFTNKFVKDDPNLIYLDGNSLGMLPKTTPDEMSRVINQEWGKGLIRSWNEGWYQRSAQTGACLAKLIGARPDEVIVADSTSVNLFKLVYAVLKYQDGRTRIVSDDLNFPSDIYILQGLIELFGNKHELKLAQSMDAMTISTEQIKGLLNHQTALLTLSHVVYKSAFMYDMGQITRMAHENGAMVIWDLSHAVGAVPVDLNKSGADMAIGCTYKYLNGGPGSIAFLYVRKDLQEKLQSPIWGWFGQNDPFAFDLQYEPSTGIKRFLAGSPPILSLSTLEPALDIMLEAGMDNIRQKSVRQTDYLVSLAEKYLFPLGFQLSSPRDSRQRGSHISLQHPEAYRICKALIDSETGEKVVIPDFRAPDNIRLGIAPLYNTFAEIFEAIMQLKQIAEEKLYQHFSLNRDNVT